MSKEWTKEHRELQYLRSAAAASARPRRSTKRRKGLAAASREEQARYLERRAKKLNAVR